MAEPVVTSVNKPIESNYIQGSQPQQHYSTANKDTIRTTTYKSATSPTTDRDHEARNIISERVIEHEVLVPKRIVREEIVEELQKFKETIIEVAKPIYQERLVEVPEVEFREKIVEVPEKVIEEKTKEVPKIETRNRYYEVVKYVDFDGNEIEPPETEVREVVIEKIVEVPEIQEEVLVHEVQVPQYIEKVVVPKYSTPINIPVPVEAVTTYDYELQHPIPVQNDVQYPLFAPRFIEVPVCAELYDTKQIAEMQATQHKLSMLMGPQGPVRLSEIEALATDIQQQDFLEQEASPEAFKKAITQSWKSGELQMVTPNSHTPAAMS